MLLDALVAVGLLVKDSISYSLSAFSKEYLVPTGVSFIGNRWISLANDILWDAFGHLAQAVKSGRPVTLFDANYWENHARISAASPSAFVEAAEVCSILGAERLDLTDGRVLDLGCGAGMRLCSVAQRFKPAMCIGVDLASVLGVAADVARRMHVEDTVKFVSGNAFDVSVDPGFDVAIISQILQLNDMARNLDFLKRVRAVLKNDAVLVIGELPVWEDRRGPEHVLLTSLGLLAMTEGGNAYTFSEISALTRAAGFGVLRKHGDRYSVGRAI